LMVQRNYRMPVGLADDLKAVCEMLGVEEAAMVRSLVARFVERRCPGSLAARGLSGFLCLVCGRPIGETMRQPVRGKAGELCGCTLAAESGGHMAAGEEERDAGSGR